MNEIMSILSPLLGDELAEAIIQHRKAKKPPFTAYAAKLQVKEYIKTGDPIAAAEMQILRGWGLGGGCGGVNGDPETIKSLFGKSSVRHVCHAFAKFLRKDKTFRHGRRYVLSGIQIGR